MAPVGPSLSEALSAADPSPSASSASASASAGPYAADGARVSTLVNAHHAFVWRSIRRLGVVQGDVDDAVQKVFLVASRKLAAIGPEQERSFLFSAAVRIASNARRSQARTRHDGVDDLDAYESAAASPEASTADRELLDRLLEPLPLEIRSVFILFELEQLTTQEIGELLEIPTGTAASRLRRARELVDEAISRLNARAQREDGGGR
jgi:RNA polymerase sigma-70 factor (ECF subfamily)